MRQLTIRTYSKSKLLIELTGALIQEGIDGPFVELIELKRQVSLTRKIMKMIRVFIADFEEYLPPCSGETMNFTCPCCGYKTLEEEPPGSFVICGIYWEDDYVQFDYPNFEGGANEVSLRQGQHNFIKFGAYERNYQKYVRPPNSSDIKDPARKLLL